MKIELPKKYLGGVGATSMTMIVIAFDGNNDNNDDDDDFNDDVETCSRVG